MLKKGGARPVGGPAACVRGNERCSLGENGYDVRSRWFPEMNAGGFPRFDGTIEFYSRVRAIVDPSSIVMDFGAGRGAGISEDKVPFRRELKTLKGYVKRVIGVDIDPAVLENPFLDEAYCVGADGRIPLDDDSIDVIMADYVFEHIEDPVVCVSELRRVLKPGGWLCARTPYRWHYVAVAGRVLPMAVQTRVLRSLQPDRMEYDIFEKKYLMNDFTVVKELFEERDWKHCNYLVCDMPGYVPNVVWMWGVALFVHRMLPVALKGTMHIFMQKRKP